MPDRPPVDMRFQPFSSLVLPSPCCDKNDGLTFSQKAPGAIDMNSSVKIKLKLLNIFSSDVQVVGAYLRTLINCFRWQIYTKFTGSFLLGRKWAKTYCKDVVVSVAFWWSLMTNFPWVWILWNICWYWETAIWLRWKEEKDAGWHVLTREMLCQKNAIQINQNHFAVSSCLSVANNNNINSHGHSQPQLQGMGRHRRLRGLFGLEND